MFFTFNQFGFRKRIILASISFVLLVSLDTCHSYYDSKRQDRSGNKIDSLSKQLDFVSKGIITKVDTVIKYITNPDNKPNPQKTILKTAQRMLILA